MRFILLLLLMIGSIYGQVSGMFANQGESFIGIEGQYDSEDIEGGSLNSTILGASYTLDGGLEVFGAYLSAKVENDNDSSQDYDMTGLNYGGYYHIKRQRHFR